MAVNKIGPPSAPIHPVHAVLLACTLPLFLGALFSDVTYSKSYHVQWLNFSSWLIAGAMVFTGFATLWALIELFRADRRGRRPFIPFLQLLALFLLGMVNALVHAKDAWASMPSGLVLSAVTTVLSFAAVWTGFSTLRTGSAK